MQTAAWMILGWALAASAASAQQAAVHQEVPAWLKRERAMYEILERAEKVAPRRRDTPLRELNITDNEIREVEALVRDLLPRSMVNISPVVEGCPCEEGKGCTDQVYVTATTGLATRGLQLSRVQGAWTIGPVQRWWLDYERLQVRTRQLSWGESHQDRWEVLSRFPRCQDDKLDGQAVLTKAPPNT